MRAALIIILLFAVYALMYLPRLSPQERALRDTRAAVTTVRTLVTGAARRTAGQPAIYSLEDLRRSFLVTFEAFHARFIREARVRQTPCLLGFAGYALLVLGVSSASLRVYAFGLPAVVLNGLAFWLGRLLVVVVSLVSVGTWLFLRHNIWQDVGVPVFVVSFGVLIVACCALKLRDFNYPVWNRLIGTLAVPMACGIVIALKL